VSIFVLTLWITLRITAVGKAEKKAPGGAGAAL
jgi:hypothetical protein